MIVDNDVNILFTSMVPGSYTEIRWKKLCIGYPSFTKDHTKLDLLQTLALVLLLNFLNYILTSCLTAIKSHVIRYCETVYETSNKNWFWSIKNSGDVLSKLKCRGFRATSLSTYSK